MSLREVMCLGGNVDVAFRLSEISILLKKKAFPEKK
jgi:hypothetical protein